MYCAWLLSVLIAAVVMLVVSTGVISADVFNSLVYVTQLDEIHIRWSNAVLCLDVNHGHTKQNCCTQRLVILHV